MKRILLVTFLILLSCVDKDEKIIKEIEVSFNEFLLNNDNSHKKGDLRFLNNEGKFINESRRKFFKKVPIKLNSNFDIVEIYDMFSSKSYYTLITRDKDRIYYFQNGFEVESKMKILDLKEFKKSYHLSSCILLKAENDIDFLIGEKTNDATYHVAFHVIKKDKDKIKHYSVNNVCDN